MKEEIKTLKERNILRKYLEDCFLSKLEINSIFIIIEEQDKEFIKRLKEEIVEICDLHNIKGEECKVRILYDIDKLSGFEEKKNEEK